MMRLLLLAVFVLAACSHPTDEQVVEMEKRCTDAGLIAHYDQLDGTVGCSVPKPKVQP